MIIHAFLHLIVLFSKDSQVKPTHHDLIVVKVLFYALLIRTDIWLLAFTILTFVHILGVMDIALYFTLRHFDLDLFVFFCYV